MIWIRRLIGGSVTGQTINLERGVYRIVGYAHSANQENYDGSFFMGVIIECATTGAGIILPISAGQPPVAMLDLQGGVHVYSLTIGTGSDIGCAISFEKLDGHE